MKSIAIGLITSVLTFIIIVYSIENNSSIYQIVTGFFLFFMPITFFHLSEHLPWSLFLGLLALFTGYFVMKYEYYDVIQGVLLAGIIGGSIFYFRVRKTKIFSPSEFKSNASDKG